MWLWTLLDGLFFGPASLGPGRWARLVRWTRYPYVVVRDLARGDISLRAMGLVYTTLLSLIPLAAFSFAILKIFGARADLQPVVYELFSALGSAGDAEVTSRVMQFANSVSGGVVGSVGFALLAWTLVGTIKKVEDSLNFVWRVQQPRSFARRVSEYLTLIVVGPVILVVFIGMSRRALESAPIRELGHLPLLDILTATGVRLAPYVMVSAFFTALYLLVPNTRVRWRPALIGALVAGVLWAAVGRGFTAFVVHSTRLTIVYAGFAFVVAALLADVSRLADPARRRAAVVLYPEPDIPAARAAGAEALQYRGRASRAAPHVLRRPNLRHGWRALERERARHRARLARHRGRADGHDTWRVRACSW